MYYCEHFEFKELEILPPKKTLFFLSKTFDFLPFISLSYLRTRSLS